MRRKLITVLCISLILPLVNSTVAQEAKQTTFSGRVINAKGESIAGAKVNCYQIIFDKSDSQYYPRLVKEVITETGGAFSITVAYKGNIRGVVTAQKQDLGKA